MFHNFQNFWNFCKFDKIMTLKINLQQIYEHIYAESAWRAAHRNDVVETLAYYALLQFYGAKDTYYDTAWRRNRAHAVIILCRAELPS